MKKYDDKNLCRKHIFKKKIVLKKGDNNFFYTEFFKQHCGRKIFVTRILNKLF